MDAFLYVEEQKGCQVDTARDWNSNGLLFHEK